MNQKAKLVGSTVSYVVYDKTGRQLGMVQELRRDLTTKMNDKLRGLDDSRRTYRLQVVDMSGHVLFAMTRPEVWGLRSSMVVDEPGGSPIGEIIQETTGLLGSAAGLAGAGLSMLSGLSHRLDAVAENLDKVDRVRFGLVANSQRLGSIHTESDWSWEFDIRDTSGTEVARITKTWAGWAKERFTKADNYVLQVHRPLEEPLRSLVVAAALALDAALKQGDPSRGSSVWGTRRYK